MSKPAPVPADEPERLRVLRGYKILDSAPELAFDDLTRLASHICGTPIALISFVDAERQWFKSRVGLDATETPRDVAFCAHAILQSEVMEVPDALADARFSDNPLVTADPKIRFYAGAPLVAPSGQTLGTLCVIDRQPRRLTDAQREALRALSRQVIAQLEFRHHIEELERLIRERDRAESALNEREQALRDLFDSTNDLIQVVDHDGRFVYVNRAWRDMLGYSDDDLGRLRISDITAPESREESAARFVRLRAGETLAHVETTFRSKDGRVVEVEGNIAPHSEAGVVVSTRGFFRDVTARRQAERALRASEARTRSIIDNMLVGLLTVDERGVIDSANPAAERIFGYTHDELTGQHVKVLVPVPPDQADSFLRDAFKKAIGRVSEWEARRKNGDVFPLELALFEFHTLAGRRFAGNIRDVSERREVERLKQEFVSTVSHELRTPLTSIRGSLSLLASSAMGNLPEEAREIIEIAERNTVRLITLINDILDLERLDSGKIEMRFDRVTAATIVERAAEAVAAFAAQQHIRIEVEMAAAIMWGDADRLVQVLVNLLSNAIKFAPAASVVSVAVVPRGAVVEVQVRDRGRGIPASHREAIFERFHQVEASDARQQGGTGLGLAICKAIVEQQGGSIGVDSDEGEGSTFWFRVPAAPRAHEHDVTARAAETAVLLYDEDADMRRYLDQTLRRAGFAVAAASSLVEAWNLLRQADVALAIIQASRRESNGEDLLALIRGHPQLASLPVVLIGSSVLLSSNTALDQLAVLLPQPVQEQQLLAAVRAALRNAQNREILLVEDDVPLLDVMTRQLTSQGIRVRTATTGQEAIRLAEQRRPGLLVLDVALPDGDGYAVVESLRHRPGLGDIPILVYTGLDLSDEQRGRLCLGPTRFLTKSKATVQDFQALVNELRGASTPAAPDRAAASPSERPDEDSHRG